MSKDGNTKTRRKTIPDKVNTKSKDSEIRISLEFSIDSKIQYDSGAISSKRGR